jgi:glycosyltransferase involved in cell wall biosynthesis
MKRVLIVQERLPHYRVPFFDELRRNARAEDIGVDLVHSGATTRGGQRRDEQALEWAHVVPTHRIPLPNRRELVWQRVAGLEPAYDLVVLPHQARYISNIAALAMRRATRRPVAMWGMARNYTEQGAEGFTRLGRATLRRTATVPDWYFAYTRLSALHMVDMGFPSDRVTVVQNAVDTRTLRAGVEAWREKAPRGRWTSAFIGSLHQNKRLEFLLEAGAHIHEAIPDFKLVVVGDGPMRHVIERAAVSALWLDYRGPQFDSGKHAALAEAQLLLAPGQVGLGVLDAFAAAAPPVLCDVPYTGPESEYAVDGKNALVLEASADARDYANAVITSLRDEPRLRSLQTESARTAAEVTLEAMVANFTRGMATALVRGSRRRG